MSEKIDLTVQTVEYEIGGKKYVLREADGAAAVAYHKAALVGTEIVHEDDERRVKRFEGIAEIEPLLVSMCLFEVLSQGETSITPVHISVIKAWPSRVQKQLYARLREISDLEEKGEPLDVLKKQYKKLGERIKKLEDKEGAEKNS